MKFNLQIWQAINKSLYGGDFAACCALLDSHPEFIHEDNERENLLHTAASRGSHEVVEFLISRGANVNHYLDVGGCPLDCAARKGHIEIAKVLIAAGANISDCSMNQNPLFSAIYGNQPDFVKYLLDLGFDPHIRYRLADGSFMNAYRYARMHDRPEIEKILVDFGCKMPPDEQLALETSKQTLTELHQKEIVAFLSKRFGNPDELYMHELLPVFEGVAVSIGVIRPNEIHPYLVLFTVGMSDLPMTVPAGQEDWRYAELVIHLPADWPHPRDVGPDSPWLWPVQWLRKMAYYPHLNKTWLGRPAAIVSSDEPPKPLGANTDQTCLLMVPDFANLGDPLQRGDGTKVHFFTVVPLHTAERDYELKNGMKAFFEQFIEHKVPMTVDVNRESFC
jgi:hypothetical protein